MPTFINPDEIEEHQVGEGWRIVTLADEEDMGAPAMLARRWHIDPRAKGPLITHGDTEQLLYIIEGRGAALVGGERLPLEPETVLWLEPGDEYQFEAGEDGLEILQGYAPGDRE